MTAAIAIANHKGGVGKTVTAVNLAGGLARAGRPTLLVDADAQAHATLWFVEDPREVEYDLQDIVIRSVEPRRVIQRTRLPHLDLLPATLSLARLELELVSLPRREDRIKRALAPVAGDYAYIVLDLAPSLSLVSLAALVAATEIIAPVSATNLAMAALGTFVGWLDEFRREEVITARLLGALVTMADPRTRSTRDVLDALRASEIPLFGAVTPRRIGVEDQVAARVLAIEQPGDPVGAAYQHLVDEVLAALEAREAVVHGA